MKIIKQDKDIYLNYLNKSIIVNYRESFFIGMYTRLSDSNIFILTTSNLSTFRGSNSVENTYKILKASHENGDIKNLIIDHDLYNKYKDSYCSIISKKVVDYYIKKQNNV